jgi:WD40 repeat protein
MDYFRSAAQVLADAAMALHHAHAVQILHRDVKPSNIMVDKYGQCWIIDFGLAGYVKGEREPTPNAETIDFEPEPITSAHIKGTPQYMAPEQFDGCSDVRTDVWGLGVTLYELCTLRRAFDGRGQHEISRKIQLEGPTPARQLVPNLPADLAAICRKAMHKDAARRYPTAEDFAADLNRWLRHEPVHARPTNALRRAWLWSKRNKGWATAIAVAMVAFVTFALGMIVYQEKMTDAARQRAADAEAHELEQKGLALLSRLEGVRIGPHTVANDEWWSESWAIVKETAPLRPKDQELRDQAAATLSGIDARLSKKFDFGGSSVALSPDGNRMLIGGTAASIDNRHQAEGAKVWDCASGHFVYKSSQLGPGPVGFARDGTPLHLVAKDHSTLLLWDVAKNRNIREFRIAPGHQPEPLHQFNAPRMAMTPAGTLIAASPALPEDGKLLVIWEVATGEKLRSFPERATALAFSRDGKYLAAGNKNGQVKIWTVQDGYEAATLPAVPTVVRSLAFDPDGHSLAVADSGGNLLIWDLQMKVPRVICRGSEFDIYVLAFTQDGTMLASAGRSHIRLWDGATGRSLLELRSNNPVSGLAFAPDGNRLAMSDEHTFGPRHCALWELQHGRGIRTLRGMSAPISRVCFSSNGLLLAGVSHDWQLGIWDVPTGRLRRHLRVQPGITADNAGLAFSPDGKRFAFATGEAAKLWDLDSGDELDSWKLENGQMDSLAFDSEGKKLRLFRMEGTAKPPYVCRIRELRPGGASVIVGEINDFNADVSESVAAPDGSYFIAAGVKDPNRVGAITKMFDASSGRERMVLSSGGPKATAAVLALDSTGRILSIGYNAGERSQVVDVQSGADQSGYRGRPETLGPGGQLWGRRGANERGILLFRRDQDRPLVTLGIDSQISSVVWPFSRDGKYLAWGNTDGSLMVCDLEEVLRRLKEVGLGW